MENRAAIFEVNIILFIQKDKRRRVSCGKINGWKPRAKHKGGEKGSGKSPCFLP
jgi:hypothetical protein